jgi:hypothetical protein
MKKPIYIILGILIIASLYFVFFQKANDLEGLSFNVEDTSGITKFIVSGQNKKVVITRVFDQWMVNESYHANQALVKQLFRVFENLEISVLVPDNQIDTMISSIKKIGVKLEFYNKDESLGYYWIGNFDEQHNSSLIVNDKDIAAYVIAPGLSKNIAQFVEADDIFWRDKLIFRINQTQISEIELIDANQPENLFLIEGKNNNWLLFNEKHEKVDFKEEKLQQYLSYFGNVRFESLADKLNGHQQDSILNQKPVYEISIKTLKGQAIQLKLFQKYSDKNSQQPDLDYIYGNLNGEKLVLLISYFQIDPILKGIGYFNE